jgi:hypothetical protein
MINDLRKLGILRLLSRLFGSLAVFTLGAASAA